MRVIGFVNLKNTFLLVFICLLPFPSGRAIHYKSSFHSGLSISNLTDFVNAFYYVLSENQ